MGETGIIELICPRCGLSGKVVVREGPPFALEELPPQFRTMHPSNRWDDIKLACRCGQIFDLKGERQSL
jgi:rubredoxin